MKQVQLTLSVLFFSLLMFGCSKSNKNDKPADVISATVGTTSFSANGNDVQGLIDKNPADNTKNELSITGQSGNNVLTVAVYDYKASTGSFNFSTGTALGGYSIGSGDDPIVSGTITLTTVNSSLIEGTFNGTTQGGIAITNGSFSLHP